MNNYCMYAYVITVCIFETMYSVLNGFYPARKRMAAIYMSQSAEKWGFWVIKMIEGIMLYFATVSPNSLLP